MNATTREQFEREREQKAKRIAEKLAKAIEVPLAKGFLLLKPVEVEVEERPTFWNVAGHHGFNFYP